MPTIERLTCQRCGAGVQVKQGFVSGHAVTVATCRDCRHVELMKDSGKSLSPIAAPQRYPPHPEGTELMRSFLTSWKIHAHNRPMPVPEYQFCAGRNWKLDFAWITAKVAVECEGLDHRMNDRYGRDVEKYNIAAALGWRVFRCTTVTIANDAKAFSYLVAGALNDTTHSLMVRFCEACGGPLDPVDYCAACRMTDPVPCSRHSRIRMGAKARFCCDACRAKKKIKSINGA